MQVSLTLGAWMCEWGCVDARRGECIRPKLGAPKSTVHVPVQTVLPETESQVCRVSA